MNSSTLMVTVAGKQTFLTASVGITVVVLVLILCLSGFIWFRKKDSKSTSSDKRNTRDAKDSGQSDHPNSETYTALNTRNRYSEYDTLESVHPDTNSDMYSSLNMTTRSPDYDTLQCLFSVLNQSVRPLSDTDAQMHTEPSDYEN
ncbi:uncharacterized protein LOC106024432 isoform X2 [Esox lucius]|uniref:uncharacterized protein LOC106024432 isoform X2 n=1 Tax=Esox lucius TaxID=8010 RepID=UPI0014769BD4|nr:uncharacterized protein LOC106024432 isoform X2 [Esox lucius]